MQHVGTHTFEAPIDRVWEMFRDQDSHIAKFASMGHRDIEVLEYEATPTATHVVISRVVDVEIPGFARKVLKPTNTVVTTDDWADNGDGSYGGRFVLDIQGAPVHSAGTTRIVPDGDRTAYTITVDVDVKVPIVGGRIANWAKGDIARQIELEFIAGDDWLAHH